MPDSDDPTQHFPAPQQPGDGWVIGNRYRVSGRIGSGGMADVLRAHDELLDRDVAVKVFRSVAAGADTAAGAERQRAELHALARLNHPNLITLYDGSVGGPGDPESRAFLVMELVEGPNLGDRISTGPLPSEGEVRIIGAQVAEALAYVHEQGMVHRDVKPANILLGAGTGTEHIRARLSDFGIVRLIGAEGLTQADSTLGTASYLAPEQARGSSVGPPADVYALGLTLVEALTGIRSFDAPTPIEAVVARLDRDPEIPANLPRPWPGLLAAMTARDPAARPSAAQVASALRGSGTTRFVAPYAAGAGAGGLAAATGATTVIPPTGSMPPVRRPVDPDPMPVPVAEERKRRNVGLIVGLILAAAVILLGALILIATSGGGDGDPAAPPTTPASSTTPTPSSTAPSETTSEAPSTEERPTPQETETVTETEAPPETTTEAPPETTTQAPPSTTSTAPSTSASASTTAQAGDEPPVAPVAPTTTGP